MYSVDSAGEIKSTVNAPPSKSYNQRAFLISSLADGVSKLKDISPSKDSKLMIDSLGKFGADIDINKRVAKVNPQDIKTPSKPLDMNNCGTCMRFLTSYSLLSPEGVALKGNNRMYERPIKDLVDCLENLGGEVEYFEEEGYPPLRISGNLDGGDARLDASKSSQYLSSILMMAPYAKRKVDIDVTNLTSRSFVGITIDVMNKFGIEVENDNFKHFVIPQGEYRGRDYRIEGDYSNASYFFAAAAITGGKVRVKNLNTDSAQGAANFPDILERMGCGVNKGENWIEVEGPKSLNSIEANLSKMPDVAQTLAVIAAFADGTTKIEGISNLRIKETDRIKATVKELERMGIDAQERSDGITVNGGNPHGAEIETYNDHRMAMSFAVAGLQVPGIKIKNEECVEKSFPRFFEKLESLC